MSHTPTPWQHVTLAGRSYILDSTHRDGQPYRGTTIAMEGTNIDAAADHKRMVECVNACAGIANPDLAIHLARAAISKIQRHLPDHGGCSMSADIDLCRKALEALGTP